MSTKLKREDFPFLSDETIPHHPAGLSGNVTNAVIQLSDRSWLGHHMDNPSIEECIELFKGKSGYDLKKLHGVGMGTIQEIAEVVNKHIDDNFKK